MASSPAAGSMSERVRSAFLRRVRSSSQRAASDSISPACALASRVASASARTTTAGAASLAPMSRQCRQRPVADGGYRIVEQSDQSWHRPSVAGRAQGDGKRHAKLRAPGLLHQGLQRADAFGCANPGQRVDDDHALRIRFGAGEAFQQWFGRGGAAATPQGRDGAGRNIPCRIRPRQRQERRWRGRT